MRVMAADLASRYGLPAPPWEAAQARSMSHDERLDREALWFEVSAKELCEELPKRTSAEEVQLMPGRLAVSGNSLFGYTALRILLCSPHALSTNGEDAGITKGGA